MTTYPLWVTGFATAFCVISVIDWILFIKRPSYYDAVEFYLEPLQILIAFVLAVYFYIQRDWFTCAIYLLMVIFGGWVWWSRHDKRRKKLLRKTAERVVDAGGRLKVVRPTDPQLGAAAAEYALVTAGIAVLVLGVITLKGEDVASEFGSVFDEVTQESAP